MGGAEVAVGADKRLVRDELCVQVAVEGAQLVLQVAPGKDVAAAHALDEVDVAVQLAHGVALVNVLPQTLVSGVGLPAVGGQVVQAVDILRQDVRHDAATVKGVQPSMRGVARGVRHGCVAEHAPCPVPLLLLVVFHELLKRQGHKVIAAVPAMGPAVVGDATLGAAPGARQADDTAAAVAHDELGEPPPMLRLHGGGGGVAGQLFAFFSISMWEGREMGERRFLGETMGEATRIVDRHAPLG